jgi:C1A family cysteine protease
MKAFAALALVAGATAAPSFSQYVKAHNKKYATKEEFMLRRAIYAANAARVEEHNAAKDTWTMAVNKFSDMLPEEWRAKYTGGFLAKYAKPTNVANELKVRSKALPTSWDWNAKGAVTPIKNQGQCGSCWAFSTTGSTEGIVFISTGTLLSLSEQQLVDCSGAEGNQGCNGGLMDDAFQYIIDNKGICSEAAYPYQGVDGTCASASCTSVATITGFTDVPQNNEAALQQAVYVQPVSIAIEADQNCFQQYSGGVLGSSCACGTQLDHGVLAAGWGTDSTGGDYWFVKNSWGADWGLNGWVWIGRGSSYGPEGQCGINMMPSYPTKTK